MSQAFCNGCGKPLDPENYRIADGCGCNSGRGVNHGSVPRETCTCVKCDPAQSGSTRVAGDRLRKDRTPQQRKKAARRLRYSRIAWRVCSMLMNEIEQVRALNDALTEHAFHGEADVKSIGGFAFDPRIHCSVCRARHIAS